MPVTAKLSRNETLGDDIANELVEWFNLVDATYRFDLRELNERSFARFDAGVAQRFAEQDARLERRFAELDAKWETRFAEQDARLEKRFAELDAKWETRFAELGARLETRFGALDTKWEKRFAELDAKWETRGAQLEARMDRGFAEQRADLLRWMFVYWGGSVVTTVGLVLLVLQTAR